MFKGNKEALTFYFNVKYNKFLFVNQDFAIT